MAKYRLYDYCIEQNEYFFKKEFEAKDDKAAKTVAERAMRYVLENDPLAQPDWAIVLKKYNRTTRRYRKICYFIPTGMGGYRMGRS